MQIFNKKQSGFTLIELLVVIAIIGILASIVLVSLGSARQRAKDARVQADLNQVRTIGEMVYSTYTSYVNMTTTPGVNPELVTVMNDMNNQSLTTNANVYANTDAYCVSAQLNGGLWGCVNSGLYTNFIMASTSCAAGVHTCN